MVLITEDMEVNMLQGKLCGDGGMKAHRGVIYAKMAALGRAS